MKSLVTIACGLAAATMAVPASAEVFDFTTSNGSADTGAVGNVRTFTVNGLSVQASAYSFNGSTVETAYLGRYDKGLGVTNSISYNSWNGYTTTDDSHTIDNSGKIDFVLLVFNQSVNVSGGVLTPFKVGNTTDNDAWIGWGNLAGAFDTTAPLNGPAVNSPIFNTLISSSNGKNVSGGTTAANPDYFTNFNTGATSANVWMVSAARDGSIDGFKLSSITATATAAVPEPATWAMMISGFGMVGYSMRRRRRVTVSFA